MGTEITESDKSFQLLHPNMQEQLYRMQWRELRPIQATAIQHIIQGNNHLIISAPTAGGKTEAAFLPILSRIVNDCTGGIRAMYVGPLKALINDQFRRLEDLCQRADIPVHKWHGDVSAAAKKELRNNPSGVLLITPESIESLFINHAGKLDGMFGRLAFIVIDELHAFLGTERGAHLHSLLHRVIRRSQLRVRFVALSATIGEGIQNARRWLCFSEHDRVDPIESPTGGKWLRYQVRGYLRAIEASAESDSALQSGNDSAELGKSDGNPFLVADLFNCFYGTTALVFANNKSKLELYADLLRRECERLGVRSSFRVHHGSLSKAEREDTEDALRSESPTVAFCSSTLEMGIDVGNIKLIGQIDPPWSASSLTQRLGRSGRGEHEASELRMFIQEDEPGAMTSLVDRLFPSLLQALAVSELLLARWSEPPHGERIHASTLVQQVLSVIAERGGARADDLFDLLIRQGAFRNVDQQFYVGLLRSLGAADLIDQTPQGEIILGLKGERIVRSLDFYAAFKTPEEFTVLYEGRRIGSVGLPPSSSIDQFLILAGRRWRVLEVNLERHLILVTLAQGGSLPRWEGELPDIHPRIRQEMRRVLLGEDVPVYLDAQGQEMLRAARQVAHNAGLDRRSIVGDRSNVYFFSWTGTRIQRTLLTYVNCKTGLHANDEGIALAFENTSEAAVRQALESLVKQPPTPEALAALITNKTQEKYEPFLSEELQFIVFGRNSLDVEGACELLKQSGIQ